MKPLWTCPACRRGFANANQSHACGRHDLDGHFKGRPPAIRALFDAFAARLAEIGPAEMLPQKTRIAFHVRMSFAQLTPKRGWIDGHLVLAERMPRAFFRRIETISRRNHVHHFRLASTNDLDPEFLASLREAYAVGQQRHLRKGKPAAGKSVSI